MPLVESLTIPDLVTLSLVCEAPQHGYELNRELERRQVHHWAAISRAQVYYSLRKLERTGLIAPIAEKAEPTDKPGPQRTTFRATAAGDRALAEAVAGKGWTEHRPLPPFLTWVALCHNTDAADIRRQIARRRTYLVEQLEHERKTLAAISADPTVTTPAARLMVELLARQFETELSWLDEVEEAAGALTIAGRPDG